MSIRRYMILLAVLLGLTVWVQSSAAQETCSATVDLALSALEDNCGGMGRNAVCYGYNSLNATFNQVVQPGFFNQPADRGALNVFQSIQTQPLDADTDEWGIAVLNLQANIPDTLPGQAVTLLLMGDAEVENAVPKEENQAVNVITSSSADVFNSPNGERVGQIASGRVLDASQRSVDNGWLQISSEGLNGWIERSNVNQSRALDRLPVEGVAPRSPAQAFFFRTGIGEPACNAAPSAVAIQGPDALTVDLTVNGADIRLGSLVILQTTSEGSFKLIVIEGQVELADGTVIVAGQAIEAAMDADGNVESWGEPRPATAEEIELGGQVVTIYGRLGPVGPGGATLQCGPNVVHIVASGESVFGISQDYGTTVAAIALANNLSDPRTIHSGLPLAIPCSTGTENITLPGSGGGVDCTGFRATSPLDGLGSGKNTFFWDAPAAGGIETYRVNIYNETGALAASFETEGSNTNLMGNLGTATVGGGFTFSWEVVGLVNGLVACGSQRTTMFREPPQDTAPPNVVLPPTLTPQQACIASGGTWDPFYMVCY